MVCVHDCVCVHLFDYYPGTVKCTISVSEMAEKTLETMCYKTNDVLVYLSVILNKNYRIGVML